MRSSWAKQSGEILFHKEKHQFFGGKKSYGGSEPPPPPYKHMADSPTTARPKLGTPSTFPISVPSSLIFGANSVENSNV